MKYKKSMIIIMLAIFLFSITTVCASEIDTPIASEDTNQMGLSVNDAMSRIICNQVKRIMNWH